MNKANKVLLMFIAMASIMLLAVGVDRGMGYLEEKKWESEREAFFEQSRNDIREIQATIQTLSGDPEALTAYMEENGLNYVEDPDPAEADSLPETTDLSGDQRKPSEEVPTWEEPGAPEEITEGMYHEGDSREETVSDNTVSSNTVSGNTVSSNTVSGNIVSGNIISGNIIISGNMLSYRFVSSNAAEDSQIPEGFQASPPKSRICASYEETIRINQEDKAVIAGNHIDFSGMRIACLGDSITEGSNLSRLENYETMSYPYQLGEILNAGEVVNLGIGGSSIGRYWENAFVDRYGSIPADADVIIVMGGTNDGFCASEQELGSLEAREKRTFVGDLDELLGKLRTDYPEAEIILATPLPNVLHDMLRRERSFLLPQSAFVKVMSQLAQEHGVRFLDLYGSDLLDTHDAAVIHSFMPDGVHGNEMGYRILAEHFAAELIRIYQEKEQIQTEEEADEQQL